MFTTVGGGWCVLDVADDEDEPTGIVRIVSASPMFGEQRRRRFVGVCGDVQGDDEGLAKVLEAGLLRPAAAVLGIHPDKGPFQVALYRVWIMKINPLRGGGKETVQCMVAEAEAPTRKNPHPPLHVRLVNRLPAGAERIR